MPAVHDLASVSRRWRVTGETRVRLVAAMKGVRIGQAVDFMRVAAMRLRGLKYVSTAGNFAREFWPSASAVHYRASVVRVEEPPRQRVCLRGQGDLKSDGSFCEVSCDAATHPTLWLRHWLGGMTTPARRTTLV